MATRCFIDANILIYAEASDAPSKQKMVLALLKQLYEEACGVLFTKYFRNCNIAFKKLKLPPGYVRSQLDLYEQFESFK